MIGNILSIVIIIVIVVLILIFYVFGFIYIGTGFGKKFYHDKLGWHKPDENELLSFNGISVECKCKYCNKRIFQDSQGGWNVYNDDKEST